ncbi:MAG: sodium-independent anion transporter [Chloroflexota bacterium]
MEQPPPDKLPSRKATVLESKGNIYFASVYSFDELLPDAEETEAAVVVLRASDVTIASLTGLEWLKRYNEELRKGGNRLLLAGVEDHMMGVLERSGGLEELGSANIFPAQDEVYGSVEAALAEAEAWIARQPATPSG